MDPIAWASASAAASAGDVSLAVPDGMISFWADGKQVSPDVSLRLSQMESTSLIGYGVKNHLSRLGAKSPVAYQDVTATFDPSYGKALAAWLHVPSGPDGNALYNVLIGVSPTAPMRLHVYLVPSTWT